MRSERTRNIERRPMVQRKQKATTLEILLISNYWQSGTIALDPGIFTGTTSKFYVLLPNPWTFTECNSFSDCLPMLRQAVLRIFAEFVLNSLWNKSKSWKLAATAKSYHKWKSGDSETGRKCLWYKPQQEPPVLSPQGDTKLFVSLKNMDLTLFGEWR